MIPRVDRQTGRFGHLCELAGAARFALVLRAIINKRLAYSALTTGPQVLLQVRGRATIPHAAKCLTCFVRLERRREADGGLLCDRGMGSGL